MIEVTSACLQEQARQRAVCEYGLAGPDAWQLVDPYLAAVVVRAHRGFGADGCAVNILDDLCQWSLSSSIQAPVSASARALSICDRVITGAALDSGLFVTSDASRHPLLADNAWVNNDLAPIRFYACAPLISPDGFALGTACVWSERTIEMTPRERMKLRAFGTSVMALLEVRRVARHRDNDGDDSARGSLVAQ